MPAATPAYTRILYNGIPYWKDTTGVLYYYESSAFPTEATRIALGTEAAGLYSDWSERLEERLTTYRDDQKPRTRATVNASKSEPNAATAGQ
jgi:hypothetical protein